MDYNPNLLKGEDESLGESSDSSKEDDSSSSQSNNDDGILNQLTG